MFSLGALSSPRPEFLPDEQSQAWLLEEFLSVIACTAPHSDPTRPWVHIPKHVPQDLDGFFEFICALQAQVGQESLDLTVLPITDQSPEIPKDYLALSSSEGQLMQTLFGRGEYVLCFTSALFKKTELLLASIARELGRIALHQELRHSTNSLAKEGCESSEDPLSATRAELAAFALGTGPFIVNGSYIFENSCCGGGCGINLGSLKTGLSMPEAAFMLAIDTIRRGQKKRSLARHLAPNQKAAFLDNYKSIEKRGLGSRELQALQLGGARAALR